MTDTAITIRVAMPDIWREEKVEFTPSTSLAELKRRMLPALSGKNDADPEGYYVEYFEKEVLDESRTLSDLGVPANGVVLIRPYDLDHPRPFRG